MATEITQTVKRVHKLWLQQRPFAGFGACLGSDGRADCGVVSKVVSAGIASVIDGGTNYPEIHIEGEISGLGRWAGVLDGRGD